MENHANHDTHKNALGKLYEKFLMIKNQVGKLTVAYAKNKETGRMEIVLVLETENSLFPLATLLTAKDIENLTVDLEQSALFSAVFETYEKDDNRKEFDQLNNDYHPLDKNYDGMWKIIDNAREGNL